VVGNAGMAAPHNRQQEKKFPVLGTNLSFLGKLDNLNNSNNLN